MPINGSSDERSRIAQINANFAKLDADTITKAYKGPTGKDAVIEGQLPDNLGSGILMNDLNGIPNIYMATDPSGAPILKIAKAGEDATTGTDQDLIFNSARNTFKIVSQGTTSVTYSAADTTYTSVIPHEQSNIPIVLAFFTSSGAQVPLPYYYLSAPGGGGLGIAAGIWVAVDATNMTFIFRNGNVLPVPEIANFKYYVLAESAN